MINILANSGGSLIVSLVLATIIASAVVICLKVAERFSNRKKLKTERNCQPKQ